jgi:glycosyltransferase involved in cell wall biosynthesis
MVLSENKKLKDLVSVIIPVYNSERFLEKTIKSIINQTYKKIEIIVVNDGSTDSSLKIIKNFSKDIIIIDQKNQGLAGALNSGLAKSQGSWFKWFSPDDLLYSTSIEKLVDTAKKLPQNTIVYSNWDIIDESDKKLRLFEESNNNNLTNQEFNVRLLDGQIINVNTTLIPISLFERGLKIRNLLDPVFIDYDLFLQAGFFYDAKFHLISDPLIGYRIHPHQFSHQNVLQTLNKISTLQEIILSELPNGEKNFYLKKLKIFQKNKPLPKKTLDFGLKFLKSLPPNSLTNQLLLFYLNKIRSNR